MWNSSMCDCDCDKPCGINEYLHIKNCALKERVMFNLVLTCNDEILNTTEDTLIVNKK